MPTTRKLLLAALLCLFPLDALAQELIGASIRTLSTPNDSGADSLFLSARCNLRDVALHLEAETALHVVYQDQAALRWALKNFANLDPAT